MRNGVRLSDGSSRVTGFSKSDRWSLTNNGFRVSCSAPQTYGTGGTSCIGDRQTLAHWGRVTHICVSKLTIIGSDNGLSPDRRQAIIWTNAGILLIGPLRTNFNEILIEIHTFLLKKMHLIMSSWKWRPFSLGLNVLTAGKLRAIRAVQFYVITRSKHFMWYISVGKCYKLFSIYFLGTRSLFSEYTELILHIFLKCMRWFYSRPGNIYSIKQTGGILWTDYVDCRCIKLLHYKCRHFVVIL